jgi:hypothetical protein
MTTRIIGKTSRAHVRVTRQQHASRGVIDIRVWYVPEGASEFVPTRKGVTLDECKLGALIEALQAVANDEPDPPAADLSHSREAELVKSEARELQREAELDRKATSADTRQNSTYEDSDELDGTPF